MNIENVIRIIKARSKVLKKSKKRSKQEASCALEMAVEILNKQIPRKVQYVNCSYGTPYRCPKCESDLIRVEFMRTDGYEPKEKTSYCWYCGQVLDWEGVKKCE